jgi:hypothetical protein
MWQLQLDFDLLITIHDIFFGYEIKDKVYGHGFHCRRAPILRRDELSQSPGDISITVR